MRNLTTTELAYLSGGYNTATEMSFYESKAYNILKGTVIGVVVAEFVFGADIEGKIFGAVLGAVCYY